MMDVNVGGTSNVVNACLDQGIRKLCYVSSTSAIGKTGKEAVVHEDENGYVSSMGPTMPKVNFSRNARYGVARKKACQW